MRYRLPLGVTACALFAAGLMHSQPSAGQNQPVTQPAPVVNPAPAPPVVNQPPAFRDPNSNTPSADAVAGEFRQLGQAALPAVVAIQIRRTFPPVRCGTRYHDHSPHYPLRHLFRDDPRLDPDLDELYLPAGYPTRGSGFIFDPAGYVMTNAHLVAGATSVDVILQDGTVIRTQDVRVDPVSDVAVLRIPADTVPASLPLADNQDLAVGDWALSAGSPFGREFTLTSGIVSTLPLGPGLTRREDYLQTDASITPPMSGGPLLNLQGQVIGMNTAVSNTYGSLEGLSFAIPAFQLRRVSQQLIQNGVVERGYLGVSTQSISPALRRQFQIPDPNGALVTRVVVGSPADDAGLQSGDVIRALNGHVVASPANLKGIAQQLEPGQVYPVTILRDGAEQRVQLTAEPAPPPPALPAATPPADVVVPPPAVLGTGIEVRPIDLEAARHVGDETAQGVVITKVEPNSPAARAGLRPGMVVEKVGRNFVTTPDEYTAAVPTVVPADGVVLLVRARKGTHFVVLQNNP